MPSTDGQTGAVCVWGGRVSCCSCPLADHVHTACQVLMDRQVQCVCGGGVQSQHVQVVGGGPMSSRAGGGGGGGAVSARAGGRGGGGSVSTCRMYVKSCWREAQAGRAGLRARQGMVGRGAGQGRGRQGVAGHDWAGQGAGLVRAGWGCRRQCRGVPGGVKRGGCLPGRLALFFACLRPPPLHNRPRPPVHMMSPPPRTHDVIPPPYT